MTSSLGEDTDDLTRYRVTPETDPKPELTSAPRMMVYVRAFTTVTAGCALIGLAIAFPLDEWRIALAGCTLAILAAISGGVLVFDALLADRQVFYDEGHASGWYRGWRGLPPKGGDPLIR